jgi:hypothetical protein
MNLPISLAIECTSLDKEKPFLITEKLAVAIAMADAGSILYLIKHPPIIRLFLI